MDETKLKSVIATVLEIDPADIDDDSSMDTIEKWDSIKHMDLILSLEEEFGVSVPDEEAGELTSYALIKLVMKELLEGRA
ncbi:acyl carrier protein [Sphingomonas sp. PAMC 26621]|uniref:acyl carrier protein n=1 Tax=Sphingomonas sp. PAMC 26621 TaxID=1112213 RepID=UPI001930BB08|nr:acyl carrier protein [Sphingomonas sp. PAMC 26621]